MGTYVYNPSRPHLPVSAGEHTYNYDARGNMTGRAGPTVPLGAQDIDYTSFDLPSRIDKRQVHRTTAMTNTSPKGCARQSSSQTTCGLALVLVLLGCARVVQVNPQGRPVDEKETAVSGQGASSLPRVPGVQEHEEPSCGTEPSPQTYEQLRQPAAADAVRSCGKRVEPEIHLLLLREGTQVFPLGFGLEEAVERYCLAVDAPLRQLFRRAGVCSNTAMAMIVLRCVRDQSAENCRTDSAISSYYRSPANREWRFLEGDELPPGVSTTRHGQRISSDYRSISEFLDCLADHADPRPYDPRRSAEMAPALLHPYLSDSVKFIDVNWPASTVITESDVDRQLRERKGLAFLALTQLGWVYRKAAPQMSYLEMLPEKSGVRVTLPERYVLLFERQDEGYRLKELRQLMHSDL